jgi:predicted nicotinamide N-methyase
LQRLSPSSQTRAAAEQGFAFIFGSNLIEPREQDILLAGMVVFEQAFADRFAVEQFDDVELKLTLGFAVESR